MAFARENPKICYSHVVVQHREKNHIGNKNANLHSELQVDLFSLHTGCDQLTSDAAALKSPASCRFN